MGKFKFISTEIDDVKIIEPTVFGDARGYFMETYSEKEFAENGIAAKFVQDNESKSSRGVLRGLHYQKGAAAQAKLVRVIAGRVADVAIDIRKSSPTFGKWVMVELSGDNQRQLYIPRGFAHGFQVLSEEAVFAYKVDNRYAPAEEASIRFDDPKLAIEWPITDPKEILLSEKDLQHAVSLDEAVLFD